MDFGVLQKNEIVTNGLRRLAPLVPYLALILVVMAVYANIYDNGFVFDDERLISGNAFLRGGHSLLAIWTTPTNSGSGTMSNFYRPMQILIYYGIYQLGDTGPLGFHLLNVTLHAANACLMYAFGRKLKFNALATLLAALIWAVHPIHTEAIAYMSGTADPLFVCFCLLGLLVLLPDFANWRVLCASLFFILALGSKETAVVFPALATLTLFLVHEQRRDIKTYLPTLPFWLISAIYIVLHLTVLNFQATDASFDIDPILHRYATHVMLRIYTTLATLPLYLMLLIYPSGLHLERQFPVYDHPLQPAIVIGFLMVLVAFGQIVCARGHRALPLRWGFLWFGGAMMPQTGIFVSINALFLEHWMYLPTIGVALGAAQTLAIQDGHTWRRAQPILVVLALAAAVICGIVTFNQNYVWRDAFTLYPYILSKETKSVRALVNLGKAYMDRGEYEKALQYYHAAARISDTVPELHQNLAATLSRMPGWTNHPEELIAELKRALELDPQFLPACDGLAYVYGVLGDDDQQTIYKDKANALRQKFMPPR
jgi:tetratricopeptide (TPR) repeat protein